MWNLQRLSLFLAEHMLLLFTILVQVLHNWYIHVHSISTNIINWFFTNFDILNKRIVGLGLNSICINIIVTNKTSAKYGSTIKTRINKCLPWTLTLVPVKYPFALTKMCPFLIIQIGSICIIHISIFINIMFNANGNSSTNKYYTCVGNIYFLPLQLLSIDTSSIYIYIYICMQLFQKN